VYRSRRRGGGAARSHSLAYKRTPARVRCSTP
jgi:hypothetical protein